MSECFYSRRLKWSSLFCKIPFKFSYFCIIVNSSETKKSFVRFSAFKPILILKWTLAYARLWNILIDVNTQLIWMQYSKFVKPAFDDFILPTKKYADIIIPRGGDNHVAIDLIVQHIRTKLGQHDLCKIYPNLYVIQSTFQVSPLSTNLICFYQTFFYC